MTQIGFVQTAVRIPKIEWASAKEVDKLVNLPYQRFRRLESSHNMTSFDRRRDTMRRRASLDHTRESTVPSSRNFRPDLGRGPYRTREIRPHCGRRAVQHDASCLIEHWTFDQLIAIT